MGSSFLDKLPSVRQQEIITALEKTDSPPMLVLNRDPKAVDNANGNAWHVMINIRAAKNAIANAEAERANYPSQPEFVDSAVLQLNEDELADWLRDNFEQILPGGDEESTNRYDTDTFYGILSGYPYYSAATFGRYHDVRGRLQEAFLDSTTAPPPPLFDYNHPGKRELSAGKIIEMIEGNAHRLTLQDIELYLAASLFQS